MDILLRGGTADPKHPFRSPTAPTWTISALIRTSGTEQRVYYQNTGLSVSNRITVQSASLLFNNITLSVSGNVGRSTSLLNQLCESRGAAPSPV